MGIWPFRLEGLWFLYNTLLILICIDIWPPWYKDAKGQEHELKWLIKVTRSDVNEVAEALLRHEKQGG